MLLFSGALSKQYLFNETNKHPLQVFRATLGNSFPEEKMENSFIIAAT